MLGTLITRPRTMLVALCLVLSLCAAAMLGSCQSLPPPIASGLHAAIDAGTQNGTYSPAMADELHKAVDSLEKGSNLGTVLTALGTGLGSVLLSLLGVEWRRGAPKPVDAVGARVLQTIVAQQVQAIRAQPGALPSPSSPPPAAGPPA